MRDWEEYVRQHLALPDLDAQREARIVRELAGQLEDFYREALSRGLSEPEADAYARQQIHDWTGFASEVRQADRPSVRTYVEQLADRAEEAGHSRRGGWTMFADLLQDVRYALRQLRRSPGFTAVAVLTLALGIGANTAIFSVVHAVLLRPLPFRESERVLILRENDRQSHNPSNEVSPANFFDWKARNHVFASMAAFYYSNRILTGFDLPERIRGVTVTREFFDALGVAPEIGRVPSAAELESGERAVILSHGFWQRRLGADPAAIGKSLTLSDKAFVITGVLPPRANFPARAELWLLKSFDEEEKLERGRYLTAIGRLKEGVTLEQARSELAGIAQVLEKEHPQFNTDFGISAWPLREALTGKTRNAILLLFVTVGLVLLIACANVANLQLGRLTARQRELAVRQALGGSRLRIIRQLLTESLLLGLLGGLGSVVVAALGVAFLPAMLPGSVRAAFEVSMNLPVFAFTLAISLLAGVLFGVVPALQSSRGDVQDSLKEGARAGAPGPQRLRGALVVAEVAVSVVLLIGAGLLVRGMIHLVRVNPGFDAENLLTTFVSLPDGIGGQESPKAPAQAAFFEELLERVEAIPGVESAGAINFLPIDAGAAGTMFLLRDRPTPPAGKEPVADIVVVAGDYFRTMRIPLLRGRFFDRRDVAGAPRAVIVNQAMVREFWPNENPIGKRLTMIWDRGVDAEIVGVVGDVLQRTLTRQPRATLYWAEPQFTYGFMTLVVRSSREMSSLAPAVRSEVAALNPNLPLTFQTMDAVLADSLAEERIIIQILAMFALLAIVLAVVGLYGVVSHWVSQRTHEIGIRMALGADRGSILRFVLGKGTALATVGIALGVAGSVSLTRILQSDLFGVTPTDPATFGGAALLLGGVALLACYIPARRATRVDPLTALRYE